VIVSLGDRVRRVRGIDPASAADPWVYVSMGAVPVARIVAVIFLAPLCGGSGVVRTLGRGAPDASTPWDEIVPSLWMGGHFYRDLAGTRVPVVVGAEFDLVVSLYARDGHGPGAGVEHHCVEVPDGPLTAEQIEALCGLAEAASEAVGAGRRVLVRCHSGYNRSGLVVAQALMNLGYGSEDAVFLVRYRRSKWALNNPLFVEYLNTGLDVARLLTGLES
jgi:hypothetical protein